MAIYRRSMSRHSWRYFLLLLVGTGLSIAVFQFVKAESSVPVKPVDASKLKTAVVRLDTFNREFRLDGEVEAINKTTVSAQTHGTIEKIMADVDDYVEKGALIIRLNDVPQQAQLKKALAGEKEAKSHLSSAQDAYKRIKNVFAKKVVSKAKMDQATHDLSAAKARLEAARASLVEAREQLSYTRIIAPYNGIVTKRYVETGETVQPGTKLMTGLSLENLRVNVNVPQSLINKVRKYVKAYIYTSAPINGSTIRVQSEKMTIFPIADKASNTFKVRLDLPAGIKGLFPGMFVKVGLVTGEKQALMIPQKSIAYRSEVTAVYVVGSDGLIRFRYVRLGGKSGTSRVVLSGLMQGEKVALDPIRAGAMLIAQRQQLMAGQKHD